jgi:ATP-dependent DNA helicase PIF1
MNTDTTTLDMDMDIKVIQMPVKKYRATFNLDSFRYQEQPTNTTTTTEPTTITNQTTKTTCAEKQVILAPEQQRAIDLVKSGKSVFITGPAGSGKSMVIKCICDWATLHSKKIQLTALTGCASLLLGPGATTIHSWAKIGYGTDPAKVILNRLRSNPKACAGWKQTQILVVDEVSMMSCKLFELLDTVGRTLRNRDAPFGGIQLIFSGDFFQLSPIADKSDETGNSGKFCFESPLWSSIFSPEAHIQFTSIFRQTDPTFQAILDGIRRGVCTAEHADILNQRLAKDFDPDDHNGCTPVELFPQRKQVDGFNATKFRCLPGEIKKYPCIQRTNCTNWLTDNKPFTEEEQDAVDNASMKMVEDELKFLSTNAPFMMDLELKIGTAVMCTANLDLPAGICNGTIGLVQRFVNETPVVRFHNGVEMVIPVKWWQSPKIPCCAISQYPLLYAWSMSIHKAQGVSLPLARMNIGGGIFTEGQTYVALSRVCSLDGLYLTAFYQNKIRANPKVVRFYESIEASSTQRNTAEQT